VTLAALIALDCDMGQGYYFSKPLDAAGAQGLLRTGGHWRAPATLVRAPEVLLSI